MEVPFDRVKREEGDRKREMKRVRFCFPLFAVLLLIVLAGCVPSPAAFSPNGKRVAFVVPGELENNLYVFDSQTGRLLQRLNTDWVLLQPRFSPSLNENKIAMIAIEELSEKVEEMEIWVYDLDSKNLNRLVSAPIDGTAYFTLDPEYSPDGKYILFMEFDQGNYDIKRVEARTGNRVRSIAATPAQEILPRYSPDGSRVVYLAAEKEHPTRWYLHVAKPGSKSDTTLFPKPVMIFPESMESLPTNFEFAPAWSPDGNLLAYCRVNHYVPDGPDTVPVITSRIHVVDLRTGQDTEVARRSEPCGSIAWGNVDGTDTGGVNNPYAGLVFASGDPEQVDLFRVVAPGVEYRITSAADRLGPKSFYPVWSPDGRVLAYRCGPTTHGIMRYWNISNQDGGFYPASGEGSLFLADYSLQEGDRSAAIYYTDLAALWLHFERAEGAVLDGMEQEALVYYREVIERAPESLLAQIARARIAEIDPDWLREGQ